ncbi:hypothetical protein TWF730_007086 [Orbilia blumenaviensis]|uniref:TauD/TfdA-like domain-containing protein n=1 Tax=Orbilia blumenaviensis TaxID=1796055 RepID=A0AAV9VIH2_9PEZI
MYDTVSTLRENNLISGFNLAGPGEQPDIEYHPDATKYHARTALRLQQDPELVNTPLPSGFPSKVEGPIVWEGKQWTDEKQWVYELSEVELKEIDNAVKHFQGLNLPLGHINPTTFPLPTLSPTLHALSKELYSGRGFFVLRTLPVDTYSKLQTAISFAGISSHVGPLRGRQSGDNAVFAHIKDLRATHNLKEIGNAAYTTDAQVFHTDAGDLIALLALEVAAEGGTSRISSSWRIYNDIAENRPDLIATLADKWVLDSFGGDPPYSQRPLLFHEDGNIILQYSRRHFTGYLSQKRNPEIPAITEAQAEALDAIHYTAEKHSLALNFQKGDMQFINSLGLVHARDAFRDDENKTRHLIRLWLRNEDLAWKTPAALQHIWDKLYKLKPDEQNFPLEPEIRKKAGGVAK